MSKKGVFNFIKGVKESLTPSGLVGDNMNRSRMLLEFVSEIFEYGFNEKPNYDKLRTMLVNEVLRNNQKVDFEFEWNKEYVQGLKEDAIDYLKQQ